VYLKKKRVCVATRVWCCEHSLNAIDYATR
jgi:hypothetical protein